MEVLRVTRTTFIFPFNNTGDKNYYKVSVFFANSYFKTTWENTDVKSIQVMHDTCPYEDINQFYGEYFDNITV